MINGAIYTGYQTPIAYITPYVTFDGGYISIPGDLNALQLGLTLRVNTLLLHAFEGRVSAFREAVPGLDRHWDKVWFGPWIGKRFFNDNDDLNDNIMGGIKAGLRW
jgi:hypothetical protein